jgi:outer membrane receptor protein involved in Fe transport
MASVRISLVLCAAWILTAAPVASGQLVPSSELAEQPLAQALSQFAARTGLQVVYVSDVVASLKSKAVPAGMPPADALAHMLRGTGLRFEFLNARTVRIFVDSGDRPAESAETTASETARLSHRAAGQSAKLEEVLVTATHQAEWASQVPMSLTVWSQDAMRISGVKGINEIGALTPSLSFDWRSNIGAGVYTTLDMRGVTGRHGVSTGVFIDDTALPAGWHDSYRRAFPSTFDLERVEVLRGAQGMLLGQGTLGGAIRFITTQPSLTVLSGYATAEWATTEHGGTSYEAGAAIGGPLVDDVLGIRVSGWHRSEDGYIDRIDPITSELVDHDTNGATSESGRIGLAWMATDRTRITSTLTYDSDRASDSASFFIHESDPAHGIFRNSNFVPQPREDRFNLATIRLEHGADTVNFVAVTSYIERKNRSIHDLTCIGACETVGEPPMEVDPLVLLLDGRQQVIAQELRLASADQQAKYSWLVGAHFSRSESRGRLGELEIPISERVGTRINETQAEGYLQLSRKLGPRMTASAGARIARSSYDYVSLPLPDFRGGDNEWWLAPRFDLSYHAERGSLFYLTAAKGYRGGGVVPVIPGCEPLEFLGDTVWNYELGAKGALLEGRAHVEVSVFDTRWDNRQSDAVMFACLTGFQKGRVASDGFELSGQALVGDRATIGLEVSYIDAHYTQSVVSDGVVIVRDGDAVQGARLPWSVFAFVDYELPAVLGVSLTIRAEDHFRGGNMRPRPENNPDSPFFEAFAAPSRPTNFLNLRASAKRGGADVAVFINNALDSHPILNRQNYFGGCCSDDAIQSAYTLTPRTVGVSASWKF